MSGHAQAYPTPAGDYGLTQRELFAAMAMQGMLSAGKGVFDSFGPDRAEVLAVSSARYADALIDELARTAP